MTVLSSFEADLTRVSGVALARGLQLEQATEGREDAKYWTPIGCS